MTNKKTETEIVLTDFQQAIFQIIASFIMLLSTAILGIGELDIFKTHASGLGGLVGFGLAVYFLKQNKYTRIAIKPMLRDGIKMLKISAVLFVLLAIGLLVFYWGLKTQFIYYTPNGIMRNLHYYYFSEKNMIALFESGLLIVTTNLIYKHIKGFPDWFKKINNQP